MENKAELLFTGCGAGYNPALGSNSSFFKRGTTLYLLDCGPSSYQVLVEKNVFSGVEKVVIFVSHLHTDHIGSLGILCDYCLDILNIPVFLYYPREILKTILNITGVSPDACHFFLTEEYGPDEYGISLRFKKTNHTTDMECWSFFIGFGDRRIYYSGDSSYLPEAVLQALKEGALAEVYQDTSSKESAAHLALSHLESAVPMELRQKVICMHLDGGIQPEEIRKRGFRAATDQLI